MIMDDITRRSILPALVVATVGIISEANAANVKISAFPNASLPMGSGDTITGLQGATNVNFSQTQILSGQNAPSMSGMAGANITVQSGAGDGAGAGGNLNLYAGNSLNGPGGILTIKGGRSTYGYFDGGNIIINAGNANHGNGGHFQLKGGYSDFGNGGYVNIVGAAGNGYVTSTAGASVYCQGGNSSGKGGKLACDAGNAGTTSGKGGGAVTFRAGSGDGIGYGGYVSITTGNGGSSGYGGTMYLITGNGNGGQNGGSLKVYLGSGMVNGQFIINDLPSAYTVSHGLYVDPVTHTVKWK